MVPSSHLNSLPDVWCNDYFDDALRRNDAPPEPHEGYCTDVFFREAIGWMGACRGRGQPFFLYLAANAPHSPHWVPAEYREAMERECAAAEADGRVPTLPPDRRVELVRFLAMIRNIDDNVGGLDSFLDASGLMDDTIFVFLTDNGSTFGQEYYAAGMRGHKTDLWEGGHRVPCFVRWPAGPARRRGGGAPEPRDVPGLTQVQDLMPTLLGLCGLDAPPGLDGTDLAPALRGESAVPDDRALVVNYSRMPFEFDYPSPDSPSRVRRDGAAVLWKRWRLIEGRALYDLDADPMQQSDVAADYPDVVARLSAHLDEWWDGVKDVANDPQPIVVGTPHESPTVLTAADWRDVFMDQQKQVLRGDRKNSFWLLDVAAAGAYDLELRRWPREADLPLDGGTGPIALRDGTVGPGEPLPIARARVVVDGVRHARPVAPGDRHATFHLDLLAGRCRLHTWFDDDHDRPLLGAYYAYLRRADAGLAADPPAPLP